jgi:hypothetical protein
MTKVDTIDASADRAGARVWTQSSGGVNHDTRCPRLGAAVGEGGEINKCREGGMLLTMTAGVKSLSSIL